MINVDKWSYEFEPKELDAFRTIAEIDCGSLDCDLCPIRLQNQCLSLTFKHIIEEDKENE